MQRLRHVAAVAHTILALGLTVCASSSPADSTSRQVGVEPGEFLISRPVSDRSAFRAEPPTPAVNKVRISPAPEISSNMGLATHGNLITRELSSDADFARIISNSSHIAAPGGALPSSVSPAATASSLSAAASTPTVLAPLGGSGAGGAGGGIGGMVATPILNALGVLNGTTR